MPSPSEASGYHQGVLAVQDLGRVVANLDADHAHLETLRNHPGRDNPLLPHLREEEQRLWSVIRGRLKEWGAAILFDLHESNCAEDRGMVLSLDLNNFPFPSDIATEVARIMNFGDFFSLVVEGAPEVLQEFRHAELTRQDAHSGQELLLRGIEDRRFGNPAQISHPNFYFSRREDLSGSSVRVTNFREAIRPNVLLFHERLLRFGLLSGRHEKNYLELQPSSFHNGIIKAGNGGSDLEKGKLDGITQSQWSRERLIDGRMHVQDRAFLPGGAIVRRAIAGVRKGFATKPMYPMYRVIKEEGLLDISPEGLVTNR